MDIEQFEQFWEALTPSQKKSYLEDLKRAKKAHESVDELASYRTEDGIVEFVRVKLGAEPTEYQERILRALVKYKRVAVRGPHGLGKTAIGAWVVLWGMTCFPDDVKIPTTASVFRQLEKYLWPEIRKWARTLKDRDFNVLSMALKNIRAGKEAFAMTSDDPALIEGAHASTLIFIFDESKAIPDPVFDAAEGAFSGAGDDTDQQAYALALSTPGNPSGRFYDIHRQKPGLQDWHAIHVTIDECVKAGRISQQWADKRAEQWGIESAVYKTRVLGEFDETGEDSVIPLSWIELAQQRWHELHDQLTDNETESWGVDPARYGTDKTAIAQLRGRVVMPLKYYSQADTMETAGRVAARVGKDVPVAVDVIGVGAGVQDRLKELGYNVTGVNVAKAAVDSRDKPLKDITDTFEFMNLRSFIWWNLRDLLNPNNPDAIALPDDDALTGDLCTPMYSYTSSGKIKIESKDDIRQRLKRSTDGADAVGLALYVAHMSQAARRGTPVRTLEFSFNENSSERGYYRRGNKTIWAGD